MANDINAANVNAAQVASTNENQAQTLVEGTEKEFTVQVKRVQLFDDADIVNVTLTFDKAIPGFTKTQDGDFVTADVSAVSLSRSTLTKQLCAVNEGIAILRDGQKTAFTRAQIVTILHGAALVIKRTYHAAGYVPEGREPLTRPQWFTEIEGVSLSKFAQQLIQQLVMQRMLQG